MHAHFHTSLHRRPGAWLTGLGRPRWHVGQVEHAIRLVSSASTVLGLTLLLLALAGTGAGRVSTSPAGPSGAAAVPLTLPGGVRAVEERGILHAPSRYAPPGIWTAKPGPGPVGRVAGGSD